MSAFKDKVKALPSRAQIAFMLAVADRALLSFEEHSPAMEDARKCVDAAWRWHEGTPCRASELFEAHDPLLTAWNNCVPEQLAFIGVASAAVCFAVWHAYADGYERGLINERQIPSGMNEGVDEFMDGLREYVLQTRRFDTAWLERVADTFSHECVAHPDRAITRTFIGTLDQRSRPHR